MELISHRIPFLCHPFFSHSSSVAALQKAETATAGDEKVITAPLTDKASTDTLIDFLTEVRVMVCHYCFGRDHGHILKTFTRLGTRELRHRPMSGTGAQSRLRQLQTNLVTVNPEYSFCQMANTHHPPQDNSKTVPVLRPKQKQNRKHDDTERTP